MPPLLSPFPPPRKEPPDKSNTCLPSAGPRSTIDISQAMSPDQLQRPASPSIRPSFAPFFTLIHDTATATTHHPRNIHYIFSDDDPSLLISTCLSALSPEHFSTTSSLSHPQRRPQNPSPSSSSTTSKSPSSSAAAPNSRSRRENRVLVLDLSDAGTSVARAHSLSSSWQILSTSLTPAPTWDESSSEPQGASSPSSAGFMLKISGTDGRMVGGATGVGLGLGRERRGEEKGEEGAGGVAGLTDSDFQALMLEFDSRMKVLRTVVEAGDEMGRPGGGGEEGEVPEDTREDTAGGEEI